MDFTFNADQLLFRDTVRDFLVNEVTPGKIRELWDQPEQGEGLWQQLVEIGLTAIMVPEHFGGLGMNEVDFVLIAQECGYVALPQPLVQLALVASPLLAAIGGELAAEWLPRVATGEAKVAVGLQRNLLVEDADSADLLLLEKAGVIHALTPDQVHLRQNESVDPSRRLFAAEFDVSNPVCSDTAVIDAAFDRGVLGHAAQAQGLCQRMIDMSVQYTSERNQFGKPIGSFQAVKHLLADVAIKMVYANAPIHRAAHDISQQIHIASTSVSHAKLAACEAAQLATKNCIQVYGAMGYTWEVDLHIFVKKAWALRNSYGDDGFHKQRIAEFVLAKYAPLGAQTFNWD